MPYTAPHNVLQVFGDITTESEVEQWSTTLRFGEGNYLMGEQAAIGQPLDPESVLDAIEADLLTWWGTVGVYIANGVRFKGFKFNAVDVQGRYVDQEQTFVRDLEFIQNGAAANMLPAQVAVAVTFRTNAARGLASTGRMYLPPLGAASLSAGGRLSDAHAANIATGTATLLTNLSNWPGFDGDADPGKVCVMSKVLQGATRRVNRVDVGDLFDTIRSRRASLREHRSPEVVVNS